MDSLESRIKSATDYLSYLFPEHSWCSNFNKENDEIHLLGSNKFSSHLVREDKIGETSEIIEEEIAEDVEEDKWYNVPFGRSLAKDEEIRTNLLKFPHTYVTGSSGSGKSTLIRNIIDHVKDNSNNIDTKFLIYGENGGFDYLDFDPNGENTINVGCDKEKLHSELNKISNIINDRFKTMGELGIKKLDENSTVRAEDGVLINDRYYKYGDTVSCKNEDELGIMELKVEELIESDNITHIVMQVLDNGYIIKTPISYNKEIEENTYVLSPIMIVIDGYESPKANDSKMEEEIHETINRIARMGRTANVHLIICSNDCSPNAISASLRNNMSNRIVCGKVDNNSMQTFMGNPKLIVPRAMGSAATYINGDARLTMINPRD